MELTSDTNNVLNNAITFAQNKKHEYVTTEHVLLFLVGDQNVIRILELCNVDPSVIELQSKNYLETNTPISYNGNDASHTLSFKKLLQDADYQVKNSGKKLVTPVDILVAFFEQKDCFGRYFLENQGLERAKLVEVISISSGSSEEKSKTDAFLINLNDRAKNGKIDNLIGRDHEIERVIQILCRRRKNNPILVGEPGVGKTAIAEGLALKIVNNQVPHALKTATVLSLDIAAMMAGTKFRGEFEERMTFLVKALKSMKNSILFIDEIHTIVGAGAVSGGSLDSANILKPYLTNGDIRCIGSTTYKEYSNIFEKDAALARRFQKVDVVEPTIEDTIAILHGLKPLLEKHHNVKYTKEAIKAAVELSVKHINDRFLPDKAIDVLDEAGAMTYLKGESKVTSQVIEKTISKIARIPEKSVSVEDKNKLKGMADLLKSKLYGQDSAIETVVSAIELSSSGLRNGDKPIGNFLFCGPTGVGKTELCKQLSERMGIPLLRFDMSEYMEKHSVAKLIGAPPGYVGFDQGGALTDIVKKNPHSIVLLDEIEKAHPDIFNILLQVMDHGTLTDSFGKKTNFKNTIVVMTSNVGAQELSKRSMGMQTAEPGLMRPTKAIEQAFTPEFRNRLDAIVYFNPLSRPDIFEVLNKNIKELEDQLKEKNVTIELSSEAKTYLADKGYDPALGARPMARIVQEKLKRPLSSEILYGSLEHGGSVKVTLDGETLKFTFESLPPKAKKKPVVVLA